MVINFEKIIRKFFFSNFRYLNDKLIEQNSRFILEDLNEGDYRLTIKDINESDFGTLKCVAQNKNGKDECKANFNSPAEWLAYKKEKDGYPPRFNVPLWDRHLPKNLPASIECHVDAKPLAEIVWIKNNVVINSCDEIEIRNTKEGACLLRIARFTENDVGEYKCQAKNQYGIADTRSNLTIEKQNINEDLLPKQQTPKFNPGLEDKSLKFGESLELTCCVIAMPIASIIWYKDGVPLRTNEHIKLLYNENNGECKLIINNVINEDASAYRCVASNSVGSSNTSCIVSVKSDKEKA